MVQKFRFIKIEKIEILKKYGPYFDAKPYFDKLRKRHELAVRLKDDFFDISYLICISHIEGLSKIMYPDVYNVAPRFKKVIRNYGGQIDDFNKNYVDRIWAFYRNNIIHDIPIAEPFFENSSSDDFGIIHQIYLNDNYILNSSGGIDHKFIKTNKILEITKNCLDNVEKELKLTDKHVFVLTGKKQNEIKLIRLH